MTKEKEISFIKKEMQTLVSVLEKRDAFNTQVIDEVDKMLNLAKYGSVSHVTKVVRLSSMRNYKLRLTEVIQAFKEVTDMQSIENIESYVANVLADSKTNLKNSNDSLNTVELFSNDYIKNEILSKTYKDLVDLYTETETLLKKVKESFVAENTKDQIPPTPPTIEQLAPTAKKDKVVTEKETV